MNMGLERATRSLILLAILVLSFPACGHAKHAKANTAHKADLGRRRYRRESSSLAHNMLDEKRMIFMHGEGITHR